MTVISDNDSSPSMLSSGVFHECCGWARSVKRSSSIEIRSHELPQNIWFVGLYEAGDAKGEQSDLDEQVRGAPQFYANHLHERIVASEAFADGDIKTACRQGFLAMEGHLSTPCHHSTENSEVVVSLEANLEKSEEEEASTMLWTLVGGSSTLCEMNAT